MTDTAIYLVLERLMLTLDEEGNEQRAEVIRNWMDEVWAWLSDDEVAQLNRRP